MIESLYEKAFTKGIIEESDFDSLNIPKDVNCHGTTVNRDFTISNENRQRAKCLTATVQVQERNSLIHFARMTVLVEISVERVPVSQEFQSPRNFNPPG